MSQNKNENIQSVELFTAKIGCLMILLILAAAFSVNAQNFTPTGTGAGVFTYTNSQSITINDNTTASVYPSEITVAGINPNSISDIFVQLNGFSHTFPDDVDILLVGPQGQRSIIMSDAGGGGDVTGLNLAFSSLIGSPIPDGGPLTSGSFMVANYETANDNFPSPGPGPLTNEPANLTVFNGTNPNGVWRLFVVDDANQDVGEITGGWSLFIAVQHVIARVTKTQDTNDGACDADCSLREAIASNANEINFSTLFNTPQTITLGGTELSVNKSVYINGPGADKLTISGNNQSRVFNIGNNFNVTLDGLTISNGQGVAEGGGISNIGGTLTITNSTVSSNMSSFAGGGVYNDGTLMIANSTFSNNFTSGRGGGIHNIFTTGRLTIKNSTVSRNSAIISGGGIINNGGTMSVTNSTVSNNSSASWGGGIVSAGTATITNTTISNNSADNGGGIFFVNGTVSSRNTIIANNTAPTGPDVSGTLTSNGYNLIENTSGTTITGDTTGNQTGVDPKLAPLGNYGGPTQTHALMPDSPALDKGNSSGSTTDQRERSRPFDISSISPAPGGDNSDIGAFEAQAFFVTNTGDNGPGSLRQAIIDAPTGTDIYLNAGSPLTITLTTGEIVINKNINIFSTGPNMLTISGNNQSRVFNIGSGFTVGLSGMTVTNGNATGGGVNSNGGGIINEGNLTISNLTVSNSVAEDVGGGVFNGSSGNLFINQSNITGNNAQGFGGGGIWNIGSLNIKETIVSNNMGNNGGGINNIAGGLTFLDKTTINNNSAAFGGGIQNGGDLTVLNSTISNNTSNRTDGGGGIDNFDGTFSVTNSTISGNVSNTGTNSGGGIWTNSTATIVNTTITNNSASGGGGSVGGVYKISTGTVTVRNSIIAANVNNASIPDTRGTFTSGGSNIIGNVGTATGFNQQNDRTGTGAAPFNPKIARLGNYGGPTQTHVPLPNSPAIDAVCDSSTAPDFDQRGFLRIDDPGVNPTVGCSSNFIKDIGSVDRRPNDISSFRTPFDFDGDGKTDISIYRPSVGEWWYQHSSDNAVRAFAFGTSTDKIVPGDYDNDGKTDVAFWRPSTGYWFVLRSSNHTFFAAPFGLNGDIPAPGDFDGDGQTDFTVYRPSAATWFILKSTGGVQTTPFGTAGDIPAVADYDGDGKSDVGIFRPVGGGGNAEWWILRSTAGVFATPFGAATDKPVQGDYTGDGKADVAFWRPSTGEWFVLRSEDLTFYAAPFGASGDIPAPGDYDGDGKIDLTVFRPSTATWFTQQSSGGTPIRGFGVTGDLPVPSAFIP